MNTSTAASGFFNPRVLHGVASRIGTALAVIITLGAGLSAPSAVAAPGNWEAPNIAPAPPSEKIASSMAYDTARGKIVLFGGLSVSGRLDETWTWDGTAWTQQNPAMSPPGRAYAAMAYDAARGRVVLFGGDARDGITIYNDTWTWDGSTWTQESPAVSPPARSLVSMAYEAATGKVVLFGGYKNQSPFYHADTWTWDGSNWTLESPATSPSGRYWACMADGSASSQPVLFGGYGRSGSGDAYLNDTWTWNGSTWTQKSPATAPGRRAGANMAYDAARNRTVLFGGHVPGVSGLEYLGDTWTWDGSSWTQQSPPASPPKRKDQAMAYDASRGQVVLFGGSDNSIPKAYDDTWVWDGSTWSFKPRTTPRVRDNSNMAYDAARGEVLLFGGFGNFGPVNDTWVWDGSKWIERRPATSPPARQGAVMAYDAARGRVVLFGGLDANGFKFGDTWLWDGTTWIEVISVVSPPPRFDAGMAYDAVRQEMVLFGGVGIFQSENDTWTWDGSTWTPRLSSPSPPATWNHSMAFDAARGEVVMFGGRTSTYTSDTWTWDGSAWTMQNPANSPSARDGAGMAFDGVTQTVVLFGGYIGHTSGNPFAAGDTWLWDGTNWTKQSPTISPSPRTTVSMAYDDARRRVLLFGGRADQSSLLGDTWEWIGRFLTPTNAVSRKTHGAAGIFDINLPLAGNPGIECRTGGAFGNHRVIVTFAVPVTVGSAMVSSGTGSVSSVTASGKKVTVNLTTVGNAQTIAITLVGVNDGTNSGNVVIPMGVLLGDTTANGTVNSSDIAQTKSKSGQIVTSVNFRQDTTINGSVNSSDISLVKSKSGTGIP